MFSRRFGRRASGVTIIELIVFMVIMGVAAAGIIGVINLSTSQSGEPLRRKQALMIAEALMEEVQLARFSFCTAADPNADTVNSQAGCAAQTQVRVGGRAAGATRPYGNVADYAMAIGVPQFSFANNAGVDVDIGGRPLGVDGNNQTMGESSLAPIRSTVTLNLVNATAPLGPAGTSITSTEAALNVLQITITTTYGNGANDFVRLDAYRTRYAPNLLP